MSQVILNNICPTKVDANLRLNSIPRSVRYHVTDCLYREVGEATVIEGFIVIMIPLPDHKYCITVEKY